MVDVRSCAQGRRTPPMPPTESGSPVPFASSTSECDRRQARAERFNSNTLDFMEDLGISRSQGSSALASAHGDQALAVETATDARSPSVFAPSSPVPSPSPSPWCRPGAEPRRRRPRWRGGWATTQPHVGAGQTVTVTTEPVRQGLCLLTKRLPSASAVRGADQAPKSQVVLTKRELLSGAVPVIQRGRPGCPVAELLLLPKCIHVWRRGDRLPCRLVLTKRPDLRYYHPGW